MSALCLSIVNVNDFELVSPGYQRFYRKQITGRH
jgi:hypothetical protein